MRKYVEFFVHFILVILGLILLNLPNSNVMFGIFESEDASLLYPSIFGTIINALIFYVVVLHLIPEILLKKGLISFSIYVLLLFLLSSFIELAVDFYFFIKYKTDINEFLMDQVLLIILVHFLTIILAVAYKFIKDWLVNERIKERLEKEKISMELFLLKKQINPHFLFNALNSLFSMALKSNDMNTAEGISKLADMMRYSFEKSDQKVVRLSEEIDYIKDYIFLQKLRFGNKIEILFNVGDVKNIEQKIPPMLFIPFIENAFKYGVSSSRKTIINFDLTSDEESLIFKSKNEIHDISFPETSTGKGLKNIKRQLELIFQNNYQLDIIKTNNLFKVKLIIKWK